MFCVNKGARLAKVAGVLVALSPGLAFAAAPDTTAITSAITDGQTAAVAVAIAFGVAIWAVRALKLIRRG
ncbi:hypothetical protein FNZ56_02910 [Pseudoluteimonas lycopersici]|uniref:Methyltransferase n=1 Tax=Pseudoluteimonas lycopersici TaxID=1324796 RepID=A0A516V302_9GAMM|nr:major capsid protein [Lysobacter lycopersici]QDQ72901.1 hypothetical protein FNZ56_02910 [Lysobacter lycopersici]